MFTVDSYGSQNFQVTRMLN